MADGLTSPVGLVAAPDGSKRLFVIDQIGTVRIIDGAELREAPFLDLRSRMVALSPGYDERGLLGLAFHPDFANNGRFFVYYSAPLTVAAPAGFDSQLTLSEFKVSAADVNAADPDSERILLQIADPQANHNGGQLAFSPKDGFLYVAVGDGGAGNDVGPGHNATIGNGQDKSTLFGKILRIDVDGADPYGVPADNPLVGVPDTRPEVFAFGFRNPWRCSFDSDGRLFVADVGQNIEEEVNIVTKGGNYGWRIKEGTLCFDPNSPGAPAANCPDVDADANPLIAPIITYDHNDETGKQVASAIIGGFVYRGKAVTKLRGNYVYGDFTANFIAGDGTLFAATEAADGSWTPRELGVAGTSNGRLGRFLLGFGQDAAGELYVLSTTNVGPSGQTGTVDRIVAAE